MPVFEVLDPGFMTTVQDQGRFGYERFGVPVSGAMDWYAQAAANQLVGNSWEAACLEMLFQGVTLRVLESTIIAVTGPGFHVNIHGIDFPEWMGVFASVGSIVTVINDGKGYWGYLACLGGINVPVVLGSRSTYLRGGFGGMDGRPLQTGDILPACPFTKVNLSEWAGLRLSEDLIPTYSKQQFIEVIPGPQLTSFTEESVRMFFSNPFIVSENSDRMGYRLSGDAISPGSGADILSEGLTHGAIQVPGNGQPIVMMSDRQSTGGYRKIATVNHTSLPLIAQCPPGSTIHFNQTSIKESQEKYRRMVKNLQQCSDDRLDAFYGCA
jgi:antagonist of KipI